jgi:hypothetical protein
MCDLYKELKSWGKKILLKRAAKIAFMPKKSFFANMWYPANFITKTFVFILSVKDNGFSSPLLSNNPLGFK